MKIGWRLIFAVTIAGLLLAVTDVPSDAARRAGRGSSYDGTWSVAVYTSYRRILVMEGFRRQRLEPAI
jgi:hypothetical protein